ncbi:MAG TPA: lipopolysaccharide heptosyltransferase II [Syntrophobacteraceae bacterium]|nr:lipopolysaccharide heptosyltransferase II [Syntrophobacteraceae bacterium]
MGPPATLTSRSIKKILIRSTNWIGDAVMTTPAMGRMRAAFPMAEIVVAANPTIAELLDRHPSCDRIIVYDKKGRHRGPGGLLRFCAELRKEEFDLAVLFQNAIEAAILATLARIPIRAGFTTDCRAPLLTHRVSGWRRARRFHHTDYYLTMLEGLGIRGGNGRLQLHCTEEELSWAKEQLSDDPWVAVNPGATYGSAKRWLTERFAAVADTIAQETPSRILLIGGPNEGWIAEEVLQKMHTPPLNLAGKTSVRQLMALLSQCRLLVTNDSGPMHVAAAFAVPIVAIFGSTDHRTTSPLSNSCRIVRKPTECAPCLKTECPTDHHCMTAVSVTDVLNATRTLLRGHK